MSYRPVDIAVGLPARLSVSGDSLLSSESDPVVVVLAVDSLGCMWFSSLIGVVRGRASSIGEEASRVSFFFGLVGISSSLLEAGRLRPY